MFRHTLSLRQSMPVHYFNGMNKVLVLLLILSAIFSLSGQVRYDYQWILWNYNHIDFRGPEVLANLISQPIFIVGTGTYSTSICNENGDLLFYTGGCYVLNAAHKIMVNGDSINSDYSHDLWCEITGDFPIEQGNTIIPFPLSKNKYLIFNYDLQDLFGISGALPAPAHLFYHIVDMTLDEGLGAIVEKKRIAIADTLARGYLQAVRHANGEDWWIIFPEWNTNCYYVLTVTGEGVGALQKQCLGSIWSSDWSGPL